MKEKPFPAPQCRFADVVMRTVLDAAGPNMVVLEKRILLSEGETANRRKKDINI